MKTYIFASKHKAQKFVSVKMATRHKLDMELKNIFKRPHFAYCGGYFMMFKSGRTISKHYVSESTISGVIEFAKTAAENMVSIGMAQVTKSSHLQNG